MRVGPIALIAEFPVCETPPGTKPEPKMLPESNASVKTIRALEEQLRAHVAVKGIEQ